MADQPNPFHWVEEIPKLDLEELNGLLRGVDIRECPDMLNVLEFSLEDNQISSATMNGVSPHGLGQIKIAFYSIRNYVEREKLPYVPVLDYTAPDNGAANGYAMIRFAKLDDEDAMKEFKSGIKSALDVTSPLSLAISAASYLTRIRRMAATETDKDLYAEIYVDTYIAFRKRIKEFQSDEEYADAKGIWIKHIPVLEEYEM